jgi:hypothetical protein
VRTYPGKWIVFPDDLVFIDRKYGIGNFVVDIVVSQSSSGPKFEPELLQTGPRFGPKFKPKVGPNEVFGPQFRL